MIRIPAAFRRFHRVSQFPAVLLCFASVALQARAAQAPAAATKNGSLIDIRLTKAKESGPLFVERFDGAEINPDLWQIVNGDSGIQVAVDGGELRIHGRTAEDRGQGYNHVGLFGKIFRESNVVAIARVRAARGFEEDRGDKSQGPADRLCHVHLCGAFPDYNSAVCFGVDRGRFGWTLLVRDWDRMSICGDTLAPSGKEASEFTPVRVEHLNGKSQGFVYRKERWEQVGEPRAVADGCARLELKVTVNPRNREVDMRVADAWMYPHPGSAPVRFIITNDWAHTIPRLGAYRNKPLRLEVQDAESKAPLGAADLDNATGEFRVSLDANRAYPVAARIAILHEGKPIARAEIANKDLDGLYPGDVYSIIEAAKPQKQGNRPPSANRASAR